jgi:hypothetical protein
MERFCGKFSKAPKVDSHFGFGVGKKADFNQIFDE